MTAASTPDEHAQHADAAEKEDREKEDLGFGRLVSQSVRGRFLDKDGRPKSRKFGIGPQRLERLYLGALAASWTTFLAWSLASVMLVNGCFTLAYMALGPEAITGHELVQISDQFLTTFSYSLARFTTSDTSPMYAVGATAHWLSIFESLVGPLAIVAVAGLMLARLIRPRMRLRYSQSAVIAPYEDGRGLMFRIVSTQPSELSDVQVRVNLVLFETTNGVRQREFHQLELERHSVEFFSLHWTVVHPITSRSPLAGFTPAMLREAEAEVMVSVNAHEETFSTRVTSRCSYLWDEFRWDAKFANIFVNAPDGVIAIDVERLDRMDVLPDGTTSIAAFAEETRDDVPSGRM